MANTMKFGNGNWATKESSTLAYNDENENFKPLPFDFSRASNATAVNKEGLIEVLGSDTPKIDYLDNTKGALLLEKTATNKVLYSNDLTQWANIGSSATVTNEGVSIVKNNTASRVQMTGSSSNSYLSGSVFCMAGTNHTFSFWAKGETAGLTFGVTYSGGSAPSYVTKTIASDSDEWIKYEASFYSPGYLTVYYTFYNASNMDAVDFYVDGVQFEQVTTLDDSSTSLIETSGSAVSRVADECSGAGNEQVINSTEGVLYCEMSALADDLSSRYISINDGTNQNQVDIHYDVSSNQIKGFCRVSNSLVGITEFIANDIIDFNKIAFKYKENDFALWVNGVEEVIDTSGVTFPANTLNELSFDNGSTSGDKFYGKTKDLRVYNTALTDLELEGISSWESFIAMANGQNYTIK